MGRNTTRRKVVTRTIGFGASILTAGTVSSSEKDKTVFVSKDASLLPEKKLSREVPGYNIRKLSSGQYEVQYNRESLPNLSQMEKKSMERGLKETKAEARRKFENRLEILGNPNRENREIVDLNDIGFREYINSATIGDESTSGGAVLSHGGAEAKYGEDTDDHANAAGIGVSGWGSWTGIAWVGSPVHVVGNQGKFVDITYVVQLKGITVAGGNSSAESKIEFIVRNDMTGERQAFSIYSVEKNRMGVEEITEWRDGENSVYLRPGEDYTFIFKTETSISVHGLGEASARFGPQVPDTWDPEVDPYRIYISE